MVCFAWPGQLLDLESQLLHARQNRARDPWLALIYFLEKTLKFTHQHMELK